MKKYSFRQFISKTHTITRTLISYKNIGIIYPDIGNN